MAHLGLSCYTRNMTRTETDKILSGIVAACLLFMGLLLSCCSSPTDSPPQIQGGDTLSALINGNTVTWALSDSTYRFEQVSPLFGLVSWEVGKWWLAPGWSGVESIWFHRREGAVLADSRDNTWADLAPLSRPYEIVRSRDSVGLRTSSGSVVYYEVR